MNIHYFPDLVDRWIKGISFSKKIHTIYETDLLGTGGTLLKNKSFIGNQACMLIHADPFSLRQQHRR